MANFEAEARGVWRMLPAGEALYAALNGELESVLAGLFGYHLLSLGCFSNALDTAASPVRHHIRLGLEPRAALCADPGELPVLSDSVDVVLLAQLLDFHDNPHRVLREAARVLIPEGALVIAGFNPVSPWGMWRLARHGDRRHGTRMLTPGRVKDWLKLLGFELVEERRFFHRPPLESVHTLQRLAWLDDWGRRWAPGLGGLYVLVARKQVSTLTPVRMAWKPKVIPIRPVLAEPGVRATTANKEPCQPQS